MKNSIVLLIAFVFISFTAEAQKKYKKIKGNKVKATVERSLSKFESISVSGSMKVVLQKGNEGEIQITGDENIIPYIETEVKSGTLKISKANKVSLYAKHEIVIYVNFEDVDAISLTGSGEIICNEKLSTKDLKISLTGSGDIELKNIESESLYSKLTGSGDIYILGTTNDLYTSVKGSGDFSGNQLNAQNTTATVTGSGDIECNATTSLKASVAGSGDIVYSGNPENVRVQSSGSGDIESK